MKATRNNKTRVNICGIGPGNPELIVPEVFRLVESSDLVVGGNRQLNIFNLFDKETIVIKNNIPEIVLLIKPKTDKAISVLVSGDPGFHSLLHSFREYFTNDELNIVPGISTFQYFFAKIAMTYEDAWIGSLHGKETDFLQKVKEYRKVFLLTDSQKSWKHIAKHLADNQLGDCKIYVGNRLSYEDETIVMEKASTLQTLNYDFDLCSVIIINENIAHHA